MVCENPEFLPFVSSFEERKQLVKELRDFDGNFQTAELAMGEKELYPGKWVAVLDREVIGNGDDFEDVIGAIEAKGYDPRHVAMRNNGILGANLNTFNS